MNTIKPLDPMVEFPGLKKFTENYAQKTHSKFPPGCGNLYVIQTVNRDGEVTAERYATNLITNNGMNGSGSMFNATPYVQGADCNAVYFMLIGSGTTPPAYTDTALVNQLTTVTPTFTAGQQRYLYKCEYDSTTDVISQRFRAGRYTYDYNISGITSDITINEIGLSRYTNSLNVRMLVYDELGQQNGIVKHLDEKLQIFVYFSAAVKASLIQTLWSQGIYAFIQPAFMMCCMGNQTLGGLYSAGSAFMHACGPNPIRKSDATSGEPTNVIGQLTTNSSSGNIFNVWSQSGGSSSNYSATVTYVDNVLTASCESLGETNVITDPHFMITTHAFMGRANNPTSQTGYYFQAPFMFEREEKLSAAETLVSERVYTDGQQSLALGNTFGKPYMWANQQGEFPVIDFSISSSYMYNYDSDHKGWNIADTFVDEPDTYYGNLGILGTYAYLDESFLVHVNPKVGVSDPYITSIGFDGSAVALWCTDTWWDYSSYEPIADPTNIPQSQGKKRYYAHKDTSSTSSLLYNYDQPVHRLTESVGPHTIANSDAGSTNFALDASDTYNAVIAGARLFHFDANGEIDHTYDLVLDTDNHPISTHHHWFFGSKLMVCGKNAGPISNVRMYDISNLSSAPTYTDINFNIGTEFYTGNVRGIIEAYWSFSENGWFSSQNFTTKEAAVLNMSDLTFTSYTGVKFFHVQPYTDYLIYCEDGVTPEVWHVVNLTDNSEVTFTLPTGYTTTGIVGSSDCFYMTTTYTTGDRVTFLYQIGTNYLSQLSFFIPLNFQTQTSSNNGDYGSKWSVANTGSHYSNNVSGYTTMNSPVLCLRDGIVYNNKYNYTSSSYVTVAYMITFDDPTTETKVYDYQSSSGSDSRTSSTWYRRRLWMKPRAFEINGTNMSQLIMISLAGDTIRQASSQLVGIDNSFKSYNANGYGGPMVDDLGLLFDTKPQSGTPTLTRDGNPFSWFTSSSNAESIVMAYPCVYGRGILGYQFDSATTGHLYWSPISAYLPHKVTGTTYTIQTYNNPRSFNITGYSVSITNDPSKWTLA